MTLKKLENKELKLHERQNIYINFFDQNSFICKILYANILFYYFYTEYNDHYFSLIFKV